MVLRINMQRKEKSEIQKSTALEPQVSAKAKCFRGFT